MNNERRDFFTLKGKILTKISSTGEEIETSDGKKYRLTHHQDCCEFVKHKKTIGDPQSLIGRVITLAEEDQHQRDPEWYEIPSYRESFTWGTFTLACEDDRVEFWFLGESNGYYGEEMVFEEITP